MPNSFRMCVAHERGRGRNRGRGKEGGREREREKEGQKGHLLSRRGEHGTGGDGQMGSWIRASQLLWFVRIIWLLCGPIHTGHGTHAQRDASKWDLLMWIGVSTLQASNIKGKTFKFVQASRPVSCVDCMGIRPLSVHAWLELLNFARLIAESSDLADVVIVMIGRLQHGWPCVRDACKRPCSGRGDADVAVE